METDILVAKTLDNVAENLDSLKSLLKRHTDQLDEAAKKFEKHFGGTLVSSNNYSDIVFKLESISEGRLPTTDLPYTSKDLTKLRERVCNSVNYNADIDKAKTYNADFNLALLAVASAYNAIEEGLKDIKEGKGLSQDTVNEHRQSLDLIDNLLDGKQSFLEEELHSKGAKLRVRESINAAGTVAVIATTLLEDTMLDVKKLDNISQGEDVPSGLGKGNYKNVTKITDGQRQQNPNQER